MIIPRKDVTPVLFLYDVENLDRIRDVLIASNYSPAVVSEPKEAMQHLKGKGYSTVFIDCETVSTFGLGIFSKFKVACPSCRLVMICSKDHKTHREIIREAVERGIYSCLLAPFDDWEILTMVKFYHL